MIHMLFTVSDISENDCIIKTRLTNWDCGVVITACEYDFGYYWRSVKVCLHLFTNCYMEIYNFGVTFDI